MKILLIGEFSRLHNSLKEGLQMLGHQVILVGTGDGYKNFPVDVNIESRYFEFPLLRIFKNGFYKVFKVDLCAVERGIRFNSYISKNSDFDVVQLINETSIKAGTNFELYLLKKTLQKTKKLFLLSCGNDYLSISFALDKKMRYSLFTPYFEGLAKTDASYQYLFQYVGKSHKKIHDFLFENCHGIIASDMDYHLPLIGHSKYLGLIPNPINLEKNKFEELEFLGIVKIFHGISSGNYFKKGNYLFEEALKIIQQKYPEKVQITSTRDLPYEEYMTKYNDCHILLDQVLGYDQGYNALESMARGKVVFTGAEQEFLDFYNLEKNEVCINALPDVASLVAELEALILNPSEIIAIGKRARKFIEKHHNTKEIAGRYLEKWN